MNSKLVVVAAFAACASVCAAGCGACAVADPVADATHVAKIRADLKTAAAETAADGDTTAAGPAGYASLKGRFFFEGTEPQRKVLETGAKGAECGLGRAAAVGQCVVDRFWHEGNR